MEQSRTEQEKRDEQQAVAASSSKPHKRKKTTGENIFNYATYGGISWIANEFLSTIITSPIYKPEPEEKLSRGIGRLFQKNGYFYKTFESTVDTLHKHANPMKWGRTPFYMATEMFVMTIGGNILVAPTRWVEGRKGQFVRTIDKWLHGGKEDPKLEAAHKEMDNSPQQSWATLWKGRIMVLLTAIGLHFVAGVERPPGMHPEPYIAPTTKWLKGTMFEKYSNLTRIMTTGTRDILSRMPFISKENRDAMKAFRNAPEFHFMHPSEGKFAIQMGNTLGYVLSVSAATATLFYLWSHFFANLRDKNKDKQPGNDKAQPAQGASVATSQEAPPLPKKEERPVEQKPSVQVSEVENHLMLNKPTAAMTVQQ